MTDVADVLVHQDQVKLDEILTQVPESPDMLADENDASDESGSITEAQEDVEAEVSDNDQTEGEALSVPENGASLVASQHSPSRRTNEDDPTDSVEPSSSSSLSTLQPAQSERGKKDTYTVYVQTKTQVHFYIIFSHIKTALCMLFMQSTLKQPEVRQIVDCLSLIT